MVNHEAKYSEFRLHTESFGLTSSHMSCKHLMNYFSAFFVAFHPIPIPKTIIISFS